MRSRLIVTALLLALATPLVAQAQPADPPSGRLWRVGILFQAGTGRGGPYLKAILQGFRDLGYLEGRDLTIEVRSAAGDLTRLPHLAHELLRLPVDVIMTVSPGIDAAMAATTMEPARRSSVVTTLPSSPCVTDFRR